MKKSEMFNEDWMLYMAYAITKLTDWKYKTFGILAKIQEKNSNIVKEIINVSPCNIDAIDIFMSTLKRAKIDMFESNRSIKWHIKKVEKYLFDGEKDEQK